MSADFISMASDTLTRAREKTARAQAQEDVYARIYSRAIELFDQQGRYPTGDEVMESFTEAEVSRFIELTEDE